ncbi:MAG: hypothetical protein KA152_00420 [Verrucomicrobiales bacterium]|nr:hypothetical protein [Verrucomicrobiales bacterium]HQW27710.1 LPS assembly lipoprotein LptE [Verrucomicrobiales bacterium]
MKSSTKLILITVLSGLFLSGCAGYQLGSVKPSSYSGIDKIHVPPFKNLTLEPRLTSLVTNAVLQELQADGTYKVSTRESADAVLVGEIRKIQKQQLRAVRNDSLKSRELSVYIYIDFHLEDPVTGAPIGEKRLREPGDYSPREDETPDNKNADDGAMVRSYQGTVVGETIQFVDANYQVGERSAISVAAEDLADKLVSQLANGW